MPSAADIQRKLIVTEEDKANRRQAEIHALAIVHSPEETQLIDPPPSSCLPAWVFQQSRPSGAVDFFIEKNQTESNTPQPVISIVWRAHTVSLAAPSGTIPYIDVIA